MLLEAGAQGCVKEAALLAALTQEQELLIRNPSGDVQAARGDAFGINRDSDFFTWMAAWEYAQACRFAPPRLHACGIRAQAARNVGALRDRFIAIARREGLAVNEAPAAGDTVRRCLLAGFADQLAARTTAGSKRFALVHGRRGVLAQESGVTAAPLIVAAQISEIEGAPGTGQVVLSLATAIERDWLEELFPEAFAAIDDICYDGVQRRVVHRRRRLFRDLELERRITLDVPPDAAAEVLAAEILAGRLALSAWNDDVAQWIARVNCLAAWCPELGIQPFGEEDRRAVLEQICHGAVTGKDVRDRPVRPVLNAWYNPAQRDAIERLAPERIALPRGRKVKVTYAPGAAPYIAARIQDLYGLERKLTVAAGKITVLVHVLAPNFRPVQITDDMPRFWTEHYPRIKQELQRRYWKHEWR